MNPAKHNQAGVARIVTVLCIVAGASIAFGDTFELRDGTLVNGKYAGGTATTVRVETAQGVQVLETAKVLAITFAAAPAAAPAAAAPDAAPAAQAVPAAPAGPVTVPAGTVLTVKLDDPVSSNDPVGKKFTAKLVGDVTAGNVTVAHADGTVSGQVDKSKQAGRLAGKSELAFSLTGLDIQGKVVPIMTTNYAQAGKGEFRSTARNVAVGAAVGNAIDDDGGAGVGAAVGAGASALKKGGAVTVPAGALLEFRLSQPLTVTPG